MDIFMKAVFDDEIVPEDKDEFFEEELNSSTPRWNKFWRTAARKDYKEFLNEDPARRLNKRLRYKEGYKRAKRHFESIWLTWLNHSVPRNKDLRNWMSTTERNNYEQYREAEKHAIESGDLRELQIARRKITRYEKYAVDRFKSFCRFRKTRKGDSFKDRPYRSETTAIRRKAVADADWDEYLDVKDYITENSSVEVSDGVFKRPPLKRQISKKNWSCGR